MLRVLVIIGLSILSYQAFAATGNIRLKGYCSGGETFRIDGLTHPSAERTGFLQNGRKAKIIIEFRQDTTDKGPYVADFTAQEITDQNIERNSHHETVTRLSEGDEFVVSLGDYQCLAQLTREPALIFSSQGDSQTIPVEANRVGYEVIIPNTVHCGVKIALAKENLSGDLHHFAKYLEGSTSIAPRLITPIVNVVGASIYFSLSTRDWSDVLFIESINGEALSIIAKRILYPDADELPQIIAERVRCSQQ